MKTINRGEEDEDTIYLNEETRVQRKYVVIFASNPPLNCSAVSDEMEFTLSSCVCLWNSHTYAREADPTTHSFRTLCVCFVSFTHTHTHTYKTKQTNKQGIARSLSMSKTCTALQVEQVRLINT